MASVLHIGFPKTATTSIQRNFFAKLPNTFLAGEISSGTRQFLDFKASCFGTESKPSDIRRIIESREEPNLLLSDELILGANRRLTEQAFFSSYLKSLFGPSDILITIRRQEDILKSLYCSRHNAPLASLGVSLPISRHLWNGRKLSFNRWLRLMLEHPTETWLSLLEYDKVWEIWARQFGEKHVHLVPFEFIASDDPRLNNKFQHLFPQASLTILEALQVKKFRAAPMGGRARLRTAKQKLFRIFYDFKQSSGALLPRELRVDPDLAAEVRNHFSVANTSASEITGIALDSFGYSVSSTA